MTKTNWTLDPDHCDITFKVRHLMLAHVNGSFKIFDASIHTEGNDFGTVGISLWIDSASITTGNPKRDEHLKAADFLDVANHPQILFTANTMTLPSTANQCELWGDLTIKGVTHHLMLTVEPSGAGYDLLGNDKAGFIVSGTIKRSDWGLTWNTVMANSVLLVGDDIRIACEIELIRSNGKIPAVSLVHTNGQSLVY